MPDVERLRLVAQAIARIILADGLERIPTYPENSAFL